MKKREEPKDNRPRFTLSDTAIARLQHAVEQHNNQRPPGVKKSTCSDLIEQLILDSIKDPRLLKIKRLRELQLNIEKEQEEVLDIQIWLKRKEYQKTEVGGARDLLREELEKLEAKKKKK